MSSDELKQVSSDLSTIRQAMRLDKRYAWDDVLVELTGALGGLLAILLLVFTQLDKRVAITLGLVPTIFCYYRYSVLRKRNQAQKPALWKEVKITLQALAIVMPFVIGWLAWRRFTFESSEWPGAGAPALFFVGVGLAYLGIVDRDRRNYLAASLTLIVWSLITPLLTRDQFPVSGAVALIVASLGSASIVCWQLKCDGATLSGTEKSP
ncbi:MAG: hypothetical protein MI725_12730 [Pirellulales bacterium]|nr:hypothetical protein [Pirellulales bacterium]